MKRNRVVLLFLAIWTTVGVQRTMGQCFSTATTVGGAGLACPAADAGLLPAIAVHVANFAGNPIPGVPRCDFWLIDCDPVNDLILCGGAQSTAADFDTDANGDTVMRGPVAAGGWGGGCVQGLSVVVQGLVIADPATGCSTELCLPITVRSTDMDGDLVVDIVDLALFGLAWPPNPYVFCADFNDSGSVDLPDLATFALHFGHTCNPPCP